MHFLASGALLGPAFNASGFRGQVLKAMSYLGVRTAVVGCCNLIGATLKHRLGIDYILGPELEVRQSARAQESWEEDTF